MTEQEAQIEALWTYEVATEKVLRRSVKKGYITQKEADEFSEKLFEQLNMDNIPGFCPSSLGEKLRMEDGHPREPLCISDRNRKREEILQPQLSDPKLAAEHHHD